MLINELIRSRSIWFCFCRWANNVASGAARGLLPCLAGLYVGGTFAQAAQPLAIEEKPQTLLLTENWGYWENTTPDVSVAAKAVGWQDVRLPHTWNAFDSLDAKPGYRRSISWYKKTLKLPALRKGLRYILYFEAANMKADVYVNGKRAGGHIGGYVGFDVDITDFLKGKRVNEILVKVDNGYDPDLIPSQISDFTLFGGLVRDVWLKIRPSVHVDRVKVTTPQVSEAAADTNVSVMVKSSKKTKSVFTVKADIIAPDGEVRATITRKITVNPGINQVELTFPSLNSPRLWSVDDPQLYTARVRLSGNKAKSIDEIEERFGYRSFEFREHGAFYLNGKRLIIRGTHRHEEHAGVGAAMSNKQHRRDMEMMKEMGANFVRLAHYPQDPEVYRAADELGLLLWDELPWCRGGVGSEVWQDRSKRLLREMIKQNYNHPSIILWSLGNEMNWHPMLPGGGDAKVMNPFLRELNDIAHRMDPGRLTSIRKYYDGADIVDVFSPSIWAGWYGGGYYQYGDAIKKAQKKYPRMIHMEYGAASHLGRHTETPYGGDGVKGIQSSVSEAVNQVKAKNIAKRHEWNENYAVSLFDWHLKTLETLPNFTGNAQWAFKDFSTPLRPENAIPFVNQKGVVTRDGRPKDAYYVFKSYWTKKPSFCYIESHTWTHRTGPAGQSRPVRVYCNTDAARLSHNGVDLGLLKKDINKFPASGLVWDVPFKKGENLLSVIGYEDGVEVAQDNMLVQYSHKENGPLATISLTSSLLPNGNILVEAIARDKKGNRCLDCNQRAYFSHDGDGRLVENFGTSGRSSTIKLASGRATIEFTPEPGGNAVIEIRTQNYKGSFLKIGPEALKKMIRSER